MNCGNRLEAESGRDGSGVGKWKVTTDFGELKFSDGASFFTGVLAVFTLSFGVLLGRGCGAAAGRFRGTRLTCFR